MVEKPIIHKRAQQHLNDFGYNPLGGPIFRLVWGPSRFRWLVGEFRPLYKGQKWILEEWRPPEDYGTPEAWYSNLTPTGEKILGPYPYQGEYEQLDGVEFDTEPNDNQIRFIGVVARGSRDMTPEQREKVWKQKDEQRDRELQKTIADIVHDCKPTQKEIDEYYTNDFRFDKIRQQRPPLVMGEQIL